MSGPPWPKVVDMSDDDARRTLRSMELSAYSSLLATFRAQGDLTDQKRSLLEMIRELLSISGERHRAEIRKSVNDEKLSTVALHLVGPNHASEWRVESRRLAPLAQRLALHSAFTCEANSAANAQVEKNAVMPLPSLTGNKEQFMSAGTLLSPPAVVSSDVSSPSLSSPAYQSSMAPVTKYSRPQSPNTNVVLLPSGTSIHIRGNVAGDEEEDITGTKRRRMATNETTVASGKQIVGRGQITPLKLTLNKSSVQTSGSQKVILVQSSAGQTMSSSSSQVRRPAANTTVPIVKSVTPIISHHRTSVVYPACSDSQPASSTGPSIHTHQGLTIQRPRPKSTLTTSRVTATGMKPSITVSRHGVVIPASGTSVSTPRSGVQVKQEGAMKIITSSTNNKLLPRPSTAINTPIVVVTSSGVSNPSTSLVASASVNAVITRPGGSGAVAINNNKVISIHTGGKVINAAPGQRSIGQRMAGAPLRQISSMSTVPSQTITTSTGKSGNVVIVQQPTHSGSIKPSAAKVISGSSPFVTGKPSVSGLGKSSYTGAIVSAVKSSHNAGVTASRELVSFVQHKQGTTSLGSKMAVSLPGTIKTFSTNSVISKVSDIVSKSSLLFGDGSSNSQVVVTPLSSPSERPIKISQVSAGLTVSSSSPSTSSGVTIVSSSDYTQSPVQPPKIDIFSSALAEADICLDPYEFIDEDEPVVASTVTTPTSVEDSMVWSTGGVDNSSSGLYQLSQGAAILSGELPFLPPAASASAADPVSSHYLLSTTKGESVIDNATSLLAHASTMLSQAGQVHASVPAVSTSTNIASGAQAILPKGKELIRILPVVPGASLASAKPSLGSRTHLTVQSKTVTVPNARPLDIKPRGGDFTSPLIDTKILILPPGIGQPTTPTPEMASELADIEHSSLQTVGGRDATTGSVTATKQSSLQVFPINMPDSTECTHVMAKDGALLPRPATTELKKEHVKPLPCPPYLPWELEALKEAAQQEDTTSDYKSDIELPAQDSVTAQTKTANTLPIGSAPEMNAMETSEALNPLTVLANSADMVSAVNVGTSVPTDTCRTSFTNTGATGYLEQDTMSQDVEVTTFHNSDAVGSHAMGANHHNPEMTSIFNTMAKLPHNTNAMDTDCSAVTIFHTNQVTDPVNTPVATFPSTEVTDTVNTPVTAPTSTEVTDLVILPVSASTSIEVTDPVIPPVTAPTSTEVTDPVIPPVSASTSIEVTDPVNTPFAASTSTEETDSVIPPVSASTSTEVTDPLNTPVAASTSTEETDSVIPPVSASTSTEVTDPLNTPVAASTSTEVTDPVNTPVTAPTITEVTDPVLPPVSASTSTEVNDPVNAPVSASTSTEETDSAIPPVSAFTSTEVTDPLNTPVAASTSTEVTDPVNTPVAASTSTEVTDPVSPPVAASTSTEVIGIVSPPVAASANTEVIDTVSLPIALASNDEVDDIISPSVVASTSTKVTDPVSPTVLISGGDEFINSAHPPVPVSYDDEVPDAGRSNAAISTFPSDEFVNTPSPVVTISHSNEVISTASSIVTATSDTGGIDSSQPSANDDQGNGDVSIRSRDVNKFFDVPIYEKVVDSLITGTENAVVSMNAIQSPIVSMFTESPMDNTSHQVAHKCVKNSPGHQVVEETSQVAQELSDSSKSLSTAVNTVEYTNTHDFLFDLEASISPVTESSAVISREQITSEHVDTNLVVNIKCNATEDANDHECSKLAEQQMESTYQISDGPPSYSGWTELSIASGNPTGLEAYPTIGSQGTEDKCPNVTSAATGMTQSTLLSSSFEPLESGTKDVNSSKILSASEKSVCTEIAVVPRVVGNQAHEVNNSGDSFGNLQVSNSIASTTEEMPIVQDCADAGTATNSDSTVCSATSPNLPSANSLSMSPPNVTAENDSFHIETSNFKMITSDTVEECESANPLMSAVSHHLPTTFDSSPISVSADTSATSSSVASSSVDNEQKSGESHSDCSPPLIARRNFEKVYRPRNSRSLSTIISLSAANVSPKEKCDDEPITNGRSDISTTCFSPGKSTTTENELFGHSHTTAGASVVIAEQANAAVNGLGSPDNLRVDGEDMGSEDWLAGSGHSLSNGPFSAEDNSDEDENSNEVSVNSGTEKLARRGRKRRRKSDQSPLWCKAALGLLKRVMVFRGANRTKGEHGAAAWFLKPVLDDEAPGYSTVISQPMDFGTVKRKLEASVYSSLAEFKSDMMLVYTNCCTYNPPEHNVRRDCELVFIYFHQEYDKLLSRLQLQLASKRLKMDSSDMPDT